MKRPFKDKRPFGPVILTSDNTQSGFEQTILSEFAEIVSVTQHRGSTVIDFHLNIEPKRQHPSNMVLDGNTVTECVLRFPPLDREKVVIPPDLTTNRNIFSNRYELLSTLLAPHLELRSKTDFKEVANAAEEAIEEYERRFNMEERIDEEEFGWTRE